MRPSAHLFAAMVLGIAACSPPSAKFLEYKEAKVEKIQGEKINFRPAVDVLFVIDDSGSMGVHQKNLVTNIEKFTSGIENDFLLDYHFGVITSTVGNAEDPLAADGHLIGPPFFIDRTTPYGAMLLTRNLRVGTHGSATEMFFEPVRMALTPPVVNKENAGFYRPEAALAVIFITDAEEQSKNFSPEQFYQFLVGLKGRRDLVLLYAAIVPSTDEKCPRDDSQTPVRLEQLLQIGNGLGFNLCDPDYGEKLRGISNDLLDRVGRVLLLRRAPAVGTIEVRFGTQVIPNDPLKGWTFDPLRNAVVFSRSIEFSEQPPGTEVEVSYNAAQYGNSPRK